MNTKLGAVQVNEPFRPMSYKTNDKNGPQILVAYMAPSYDAPAPFAQTFTVYDLIANQYMTQFGLPKEEASNL
jgi:hypothetical protein